jgi:hypothetical protein
MIREECVGEACTGETVRFNTSMASIRCQALVPTRPTVQGDNRAPRVTQPPFNSSDNVGFVLDARRSHQLPMSRRARPQSFRRLRHRRIPSILGKGGPRSRENTTSYLSARHHLLAHLSHPICPAIVAVNIRDTLHCSCASSRPPRRISRPQHLPRSKSVLCPMSV